MVTIADGKHMVNNLKDAQKTLRLLTTLRKDAAELRRTSGLEELEASIDEMKKVLTQWAVETETEQIKIEGFHATLVKQFYDGRFIATQSDIRGDEGRKVKTLYSIIHAKFDKDKAKRVWIQVTRRVADKEALEAVIAEGTLSIDEVSPSYVEKEKAPYIRVFQDD